jgi:hypothetical protein
VIAHLLAAAGAEVKGAQGLLFRPWARPTELEFAHILYELPGVSLYGLSQQQPQPVQSLLVTAFHNHQSVSFPHPFLGILEILVIHMPCRHSMQTQDIIDTVKVRLLQAYILQAASTQVEDVMSIRYVSCMLA